MLRQRLARLASRSAAGMLQAPLPATSSLSASVLRRVDLAPKAAFRLYSGGPGPLTREFVQERILGVLSNCDKVEESKLTPTATFAELGLDSLDVVDALFYIEEEFFIEIPDQDANEITTIEQAVDYILKQPDAY